MTTFLDVGAHTGQTLDAVIGRFKTVIAFEPMPVEYAAIKRYAGPGVFVRPYGLLDKTCDRVMYGLNDIQESTVYEHKQDVDETVMTVCCFVEASSVIRGLSDDTILMKLNCEGSEVAIIDNLMDTGAIDRIAHVMIDFDVRKITGMEDMAQRTLDRMAAVGFDRFSLATEVMLGHGKTHADRTWYWLSAIGYDEHAVNQ